METPDKNLVKKRFSRSLSTYAESADIQRSMAEKLTGMIVRQGTSFPKVLEIGAGSGILTGMLDGKITWNARTVNDLAEDCAPFHTGRLHTVFVAGDAETLDWGDTAFDLICSNAVFQWFADLPAFLRKSKKILSPGGMLAFTSFGPENLRELKQLTGHGLDYYPPERLAEILVSCGFAVTDRSEEIRKCRFDDPLDILRKMRRTGVGASADKSWWTPHLLSEFRRRYRERFGTADHRVELTWHPIYILARTGG